jgi:membrane protein
MGGVVRQRRERLRELRRRMRRHATGLLAAGVSFYLFLGLFPAVGAAVSIFGLVAGSPPPPRLGAAAPMSPARAVLREYRQNLPRQPRRQLGVGAAVGFLLTLWSASKGASGLMKALNEAHEVPETRGFLATKGIALVITLAGIVVLVLLAAVSAAAVPALLRLLGLDRGSARALILLRWPVLIVVLPLALGPIYRYGPCHRGQRPGWLSPGALAATAVWVVGSFGLSVYLGAVSGLDRTYGTVAAAVALLFWIYVAALAALVGAEINASQGL